MKKKLQVREIKIDLFEAYIFVFWDCSRSDCAKWIKKNLKGIPEKIPNWLLDENNSCNGVCLSDIGGSANSVIWISQNPKTPRGQELLAHEAAHASFRVMKHWSIEIDENTQEILAALVSLIMKKSLALIKKMK